MAWPSVLPTLAEGRLPAGGSEVRVLRLAASVAGAAPLDLPDAVAGPDRTKLALVRAAVSHTDGSHQHKGYLVQRPVDSGSGLLSAGTPVLELGALHPAGRLTVRGCLEGKGAGGG